ncbi:MAG TPA: EAL domain-containing protein [Steroidobacteraceae bacterium]|jgi:diguanylate cyclase (GGDEF)-like protein/PAS domain S-box-containing protein|nr:EAL domain-containing protein [Steroidobacteraceae bacterium]
MSLHAQRSQGSVSEEEVLGTPVFAEQMLRSLLSHLEGMVFRCSSDAEARLEYLSEGCEQLTGYRAAHLMGGSLTAVVHADDRALREQAVAQALVTRERYVVQYRLVGRDGGIRWVSERGLAIFGERPSQPMTEGFIEDITERKRTEEALEELEQRCQSMFENSVEGMFRADADGQWISANRALARIYGYETPEELIRSMDDSSREELRRRLESDGAVEGLEWQARKQNGDTIWVSMTGRVNRDAEGKVTHYEGTIEDVTERRRIQAHIQQQANFDSLTGLANRGLLDERVRQAIKQAEGSGGRVTVALVDLDQFKLINDSFGHHAGDTLLKTVAERLKACVRESDTVARQGGDEFVLVLRNYANDDELTGIMQRIQASISQPWSAGRRELNVTCSIGIAVYPQDGRSADMLLRNADSAMYKAKESGRNNYQFFTAELNRVIFERLSVERRLRGALVRKQFVLHYQPRVNIRTGRIVGGEALLRWRAPQGDLYGPARFITVAETTGLIVPIGKWVLRTACDQARSWQVQGLRSIVVSVNVSPRQFAEGDMVQTVAEALEQSGLPPRCLQLELTENMIMGDAEKYVSMLRDLKRLGVQLAVDDFGTGYSSLSYLKRFPVDHLKIDRAFIKDIATDPDDGAIVQTIIALGHKLGMRIVAEGVECEEQREYLHRARCDEMQGFYYSKPVPAPEFAAMLSDSTTDPLTGVGTVIA